MPRPRLPIHHTFGPLATKNQQKLANSLRYKWSKWIHGSEIEELRSELSTAFDMYTSLFATGRDALLASLRALDIKTGDEIIIQGFTCAVVPNAIHTAGATPIYVDIDPETLSLDCTKIQSKITSRTRAIICQHTFGIPADTTQLRAICDKRNLALIEDCAHVIPDIDDVRHESSENGLSSDNSIGKYGDIILFSFGRDKAISGVTGGAVLTRHNLLSEVIASSEQSADNLSRWKVFNLISYPLRYAFAKKLWNFPNGAIIAKVYLRLIRMIKLLPPVLSVEEKKGGVSVILHQLPNACATLALQQLNELSALNDHRRKLTELYKKASKKYDWHVPEGVSRSPALQKFPIYVRNADEIRSLLKREQIYLYDGWCGAVVNPRSINQELMGYAAGVCPVAEDVSRHILTLPVHPMMEEEDVEVLVERLHNML